MNCEIFKDRKYGNGYFLRIDGNILNYYLTLWGAKFGLKRHKKRMAKGFYKEKVVYKE